MIKGYKQLVQIIEQRFQAVQIKRDISTTNIAMKLNIWQKSRMTLHQMSFHIQGWSVYKNPVQLSQ